MIPVAEASARIIAAMPLMPAEQVGVGQALGRVLAADIASRLTQPPVDVSAMDGYAVRQADVTSLPATLEIAGEAPAGGTAADGLQPGQAVRIFTGGPVPAGADTIVLQEDVDTDGAAVTVREAPAAGHFIRAAGLDFRAGEVRLHVGRVLTARDIGLAAAMDHPWLPVRRRPRVAILSTGDEIVMPGEPRGATQIVSSNNLSLAAFVTAWGGEPVSLGIAPDSRDALAGMAAAAKGADLLLTSGGASVGDRDLVRQVLGESGMTLDFWRIAMRPGKPLLFGDLNGVPVLGLPGNPVSSLVCAMVFLRPALEAMLGVDRRAEPPVTAKLAIDLAENDKRQDYLRARRETNGQGEVVVTPFDKQDSSMLAVLAEADCLVVRPPHAAAAAAGERVQVIPLEGGLMGV